MHVKFIKMAVKNCFKNQNDLVVTLECIMYVIYMYNIALSLKDNIYI